MTNSHTTTDILTNTSTWPTTVKWVMTTMKTSHIIESSDMDTQMTIQWTSSFMDNGPMTYHTQDLDTICMDSTTVMMDTLLIPLLSMVTMVMTVIWQCQCTMAMVSESLSLITGLSQTFLTNFYWLCLIHPFMILTDFLGHQAPHILPLNLMEN